MNFAVMQPYLFPYLGYYQLVNAVDAFIFYDDVTYIKNGYINRNNILVNGQAQRFTVPVPGASSNILIKELNFDANVKKTLKTISQSYAKSPYFNDVYPIIEKILTSTERQVHTLCANSIISVFSYLGINKQFKFSSELEYNRDLPAADKLIAMAGLLNGKHYINSPGGKDLYSKEYFSNKGVNLSFIEMQSVIYEQGKSEFVPYLSMIDVLMWNSKEQVKKLLTKSRLV
ncbi:WbqC family protein [Pseudoalteromonas sp. SR43-6]|uniref:WbqC family protein n=1 Tax=unclassified Pseudoalteromonas TaxID=194690 RepID=UPI0015FA950E|nr:MULTISPECIES: WbqC family protein [unclassified Pseudoalteromonas]MBB1290171.1 WbqC family protein [Pseudoalteromonas sp. SR41-5]MBB1373820.1 WbqC family protein [Pseudoalteromonas sp. SR43-6]MBB1412871.1 WbqC family protein [Pseudoalteromonas sp. SG43-8]